MKIDEMLKELRRHRDQLNEVIDAMERMQVDGPKKRGRPTKRAQELRREQKERAKP